MIKKNIPHINEILFSVAFDGKTYKDVQKDRKFIRNWKRKFYRQQFLSELIKLHRLYGGEIGRNLRRCYTDFELTQLSYDKVRSRKWDTKCAGIKELGEMKIKKAVPTILKYTTSKHQTLKMVAIIEVIHLRGLEGISLLEDYQEHINDWIQLNLLEFIKETTSNHVPDFAYLLESKNASLVVFGLRLLKMFHQDQHLLVVKNLRNSPIKQINLQAEITYRQLKKTAGEVVFNKAYNSSFAADKSSKPEENDELTTSFTVLLRVPRTVSIFALCSNPFNDFVYEELNFLDEMHLSGE